jgi:protein-S-isoprenylcysteine O-methyltransferase Ste14
LFLVAAPGVVAILVPWYISGWHAGPPFFGLPALAFAGYPLGCLGAVGVLDSFRRFAIEGLGTPAPPFPTERLIVTGFYRFVRNPMYVGVIALIAGQALVLGDKTLMFYAAFVWVAFHLFVVFYEEPTLTRRYGREYANYRAAVRRWFPRLKPWRP